MSGSPTLTLAAYGSEQTAPALRHSLGRSQSARQGRGGFCDRVPDFQEYVLLGSRQRAEQFEQRLLPGIFCLDRRAGRREGQQVGGLASERCGKPAHPVQGELTFAPFQMTDLLRCRVHEFRQLPLPQPSLGAQLSDPVRHLLGTAQPSPSGERSRFGIRCSLIRSLWMLSRCSPAALPPDRRPTDAASATRPVAKRTACTIRPPQPGTSQADPLRAQSVPIRRAWSATASVACIGCGEGARASVDGAPSKHRRRQRRAQVHHLRYLKPHRLPHNPAGSIERTELPIPDNSTAVSKLCAKWPQRCGFQVHGGNVHGESIPAFRDPRPPGREPDPPVLQRRCSVGGSAASTGREQPPTATAWR